MENFSNHSDILMWVWVCSENRKFYYKIEQVPMNRLWDGCNTRMPRDLDVKRWYPLHRKGLSRCDIIFGWAIYIYIRAEVVVSNVVDWDVIVALQRDNHGLEWRILIHRLGQLSGPEAPIPDLTGSGTAGLHIKNLRTGSNRKNRFGTNQFSYNVIF